ncbi:Hypothetical predicted protein [Podarcis lilfordi]|uniref:Uncharacterized protein n=1 Tax=Podarcis lilfordi TaxID=74358 RepID=A0AA35L2G3_9SAUR|nr:Hypothetical predicted protein [Podarcis lilfordi]
MAGRGRGVLQPSRPAEESARQAGAGVRGRTEGRKEGGPAGQRAPPAASHPRGLLSARDALSPQKTGEGTEAAVTSFGPCFLPQGLRLEHHHQTGPLEFGTASAESAQQGERLATVLQDDLGRFKASLVAQRGAACGALIVLA